MVSKEIKVCVCVCVCVVGVNDCVTYRVKEGDVCAVKKASGKGIIRLDMQGREYASLACSPHKNYTFC